MLRIIQSKSAEAAKSYYSRADYLTDGQELSGNWRGKGAAMLGLTGLVEKQAFERLCRNEHPLTGKQLTERNRTGRTVGYDFNFHVPKGISVAYALLDDDRILTAFQDAVDETMVEIERDAATRVRKHNGNTDRNVGNLTWATFVHKTARPVGGVPDPHLHAHCFVFNVVKDEKEKCLESRPIPRDQTGRTLFRSGISCSSRGQRQSPGLRHRPSWQELGYCSSARSRSREVLAANGHD